MNSAHSFSEGMDVPEPEWKIGTKIKCMNGRFKGAEGIISYWNPNGHDDDFYMRVEPDLGERLNPNNWAILVTKK